MNFEHMPELRFKWAYPLIWVVMIMTVCGMLVYFRRKGWIGSSDSEPSDDDEPED